MDTNTNKSCLGAVSFIAVEVDRLDDFFDVVDAVEEDAA